MAMALGGAAPALAKDQAACACTLSAPQTAEDAKFKAIYTAEWDWRQHQFADDEDSDTSNISPNLPDVSEAAQEKRLNRWQDVERQLETIDRAKLSPDNRVNFDVYKAQIDVLINQQKYKDYQRPLNADTSFWGNLAGTARRTFTSAHDYRNYIAQLNDFPRYFDQQIANMRAGLARGFTPPQVTLKGRDDTVTSVTDVAKPQDSIFYQPFQKMPASIPAATQAQLRADAVTAIEKSVIPAHKALLSFLRDDYIPHAQPSIHAYDLPNGKAYYQAKIKEFTTLDLTPEQIHQVGLEQVAQIHAEMLQTMKDAKFQGTFPQFLAFLRSDPQFYAKTPEELLKDAAWVAKEFDGVADKWFGHLPRRRFAIVPVPADIAPYYTGGRGGPGIYLVNTYDLPARKLYSLPALTLHESAPGHAFQMPLAAENKNLPPFRQNTYISAYGEGWALYCEKLGEEMGIYHTPYERFGMLSYQMWRATRLVVDTGIHSMGWTREQAQKYMHDNTALDDHEIQTEVDRYIAWPAQALSYYLGEMAILQDRAKAEKALGPKFNIRAFHDTVLQMGSVPLPVLNARIDRFIADGGVGPYPDEE
ncbi:MAG: DUF885 domain-containing protein [Sphingomonas sp.]